MPISSGAAARRVDGLEEERVTPIAIHLDNPERARALYLLTLARGDLTAWERTRLDDLLKLVLQLLAQPDVTGLEARNLVERRRSEAIRSAADRAAVVERVRTAPRSYILSQPAADLARQAAFIDPVPARGEASVAAIPIDPGRWRVEVAARDRPGLLQAVSGAIAAQGFDIVDAVVATWNDGAALSAFVVQCDESTSPENGGAGVSPDPVALEADIVAALGQPLKPTPNRDAKLRFDDNASPWYTICEVESPDRRGLLQDLTAAMASAGANVHSARLATTDGVAVDRFELTDRNGQKLDEAMEQAAIEAVRHGVTPKSKSFGRLFARSRTR